MKGLLLSADFFLTTKSNIFLYKINKCSKKTHSYRFIGLIMRYNTNIQKICLENMFGRL